MTGPGGRFQEDVTALAEKYMADAAIVIVVDVEHGTGFACQGNDTFIEDLPQLLRYLADKIEADRRTPRTADVARRPS